jgi:hypothetical protein
MQRTLWTAGVVLAALIGPALGAEPAQAATPALRLDASELYVAPGATFDKWRMSVHNHLAEPATGYEIVFDVSKLDRDLVRVAADPDACPGPKAGTYLLCDPPPIGEEDQFIGMPGLRLLRASPRYGDAGPITVAAFTTGDHRPVSPPLVIHAVVPSPGADLRVTATDLHWYGEHSGPTQTPMRPGEMGLFQGGIENVGDRSIHHLVWTATLPPHVTFPNTPAGCTASANKRVLRCTTDQNISPRYQSTQDGVLRYTVVVRADQDAPDGTFPGGVFTASAKWSMEPSGPGVDPPPAPTRPPGVERRSTGRVAAAATCPPPPGEGYHCFVDLNPADNRATFAAVVKGWPAGPTPPPATTAPGPGDGGGLPITGGSVAPLAAGGAATLLAGIALILATRRRRQPR